jgi:glycosyltransferase involved in cell wall biosynthesis
VTRRIHVLHVVYSLRIGGSEKLALDIATHLDPQRFQSTVCAMDLDGDLAGELELKNIPHTVLHRRGIELRIFKRLHELVREQRIDVVHTHHFTQLFYAACPARLAGARIVHTEHEFFSYTESGVPRRLVRPLASLCDAVTVVGNGVADYFVDTVGFRRDDLTVIPNGVDIDAFRYDRCTARRELGLDPCGFVVGTVGRLEPEKDHATLLEVFRQVRLKHPSARLLIGGDGSLAGELKVTASRLGIADAVLFLGYRRDIPRLLAAMDLFVLPSRREGLPISLIEAQAAGTPVIASAVGSIGTLVRGGENGFLVPAADTRGFVAAIEHLIDRPDVRQRVAAAGRRTVADSFSLATTVRAYENLYLASDAKRHVWN